MISSIFLDNFQRKFFNIQKFYQVKEGIALQKMGVSPYTGDVVHETPLSIQLFCILGPYSQYFFIFIDILIAAVSTRLEDTVNFYSHPQSFYYIFLTSKVSLPCYRHHYILT